MPDSLDRTWIESMQSQGYSQDQIDAMLAASYSALQIVEQHKQVGVPDQMTALAAQNFAQFLELCQDGQMVVKFLDLGDSSTWEFDKHDS